MSVVAAVDALALELIQAGLEVLRRQEDGRLDARQRVLDAELPGRLLQLGLEFLGLLSVKCSGFSIVLVLSPSRNIQVEPWLVAVPGWDLISTRNRPPGVAMNRSTSRTWPRSVVNVKVCQARYGSASGIWALMWSRADCSQEKAERCPCHRCDCPLSSMDQ